MNLFSINMFRTIIKSYEVSGVDADIKKEVKKQIIDSAKATLNDLENRIPTERQLELQSNIIDFKYNIKKNEHILKNLDFYEGDDGCISDGCSEINGICDFEHLIEEAEKELHDIAVKKVSVA